MPTENIHLLRHEIHSSFNTGDFNSNTFVERLANLFTDYPTGTAQNYHMYIHAMQEYNRKLDQLGFANNIVTPIDAGFRPLNFDDFFGVSSSPGVADYLELQDGSFLFQENGFKLILEQDI